MHTKDIYEITSIKNAKKEVLRLEQEGKILVNNKVTLKYSHIKEINKSEVYYYFIVLDENYEEIKNPITNELWEIKYLFRKKPSIEFNKNFVYECSYEYEFLNQLISLNDDFKIKTKFLKEHKYYNNKFGKVIQNYFDECEEDFIEKLKKDFLDIINEDYEKCIKEKKKLLIEKQKEIKEEKNRLKFINSEVNTLQKEKKHLEIRVENLTRVLKYNEQKNNSEKIENPEEYYEVKEGDDYFEVIQKALYYSDEEYLIYNKNIVRKFITSLNTDQLILLSGPSGTGKSSLVSKMSEIFNNIKVHIIPVQSNWNDERDILGFYNLLEKIYSPTPFLNALIEARLDVDKEILHIICLDEINLAHIEYYFASFLSVMEQKDKKIHLYSNENHNQMKNELEIIFKKELKDITMEEIENINKLDLDISQEQKIRACNLYKSYYYCPASFIIPDNVRFVGTLNMDETVRPISPKVIDRSFIIELTEQNMCFEFSNNIEIKKIKFDVDRFKLASKKENLQSKELIKKIDDLIENIKTIPNININQRGKMHFLKYINSLKRLEKIIDDNEIIDDLLCLKVLPRINFSKNNEDEKKYESFLNDLKNYKEDYPYAYNKANSMKKERRITFW